MAYIWGNLDDWAHSTKALQVLDQAMTLECVSALEKGEIFSTGAVLQVYQRDLQGAIGYSVKARDIFHSIEEREREFWERVNLSTYLFHEYQFENAWQELQRAGDLIDERIHKKALVQFYSQRAEQELSRGLYDESIFDLKILIGLNDDIGYYGDFELQPLVARVDSFFDGSS